MVTAPVTLDDPRSEARKLEWFDAIDACLRAHMSGPHHTNAQRNAIRAAMTVMSAAALSSAKRADELEARIEALEAANAG